MRNNGHATKTTRRRKPQRPTWERDVLVPAGQALLIALGLGLGALVATIALAAWRGWRWWLPPTLSLSLSFVTFAVSVVVLVADHRRLLWAWEETLQVDLDGDKEIGQPDWEKEARETLEPNLVYVHDPRRRRQQEEAKNFRFWLREAFNGRGTTWRAWDGVELPDGNLVTRPVWEKYTERLLKAGLAERPYDTAPLELCCDYRAALETFAEAL